MHGPASSESSKPTATEIAESSLEVVRREQAAILVVTLLLLDVALLTGNALYLLLYDSGRLSNPVWNGDIDRSFIEMLGQAKLLLAVVMLLSMWRSRGSGLYAAWALVFATVIADDFLMVHETGGAWLASTFEWSGAFGLRAGDLGELAVWAVLGVVLLVVLGFTHWRASRERRSVTWVLMALLVVLAVFAVLVDMVAIVLTSSVAERASEVLGFVETAGEPGAMTLIALVIHRMTLGLPVVPRRFRK